MHVDCDVTVTIYSYIRYVFLCFVLLLNIFQFRSQVMTNISVLQKEKRDPQQNLCMVARKMGCDLATRQRQDKDYVNFK